jgi:hypothetical protein
MSEMYMRAAVAYLDAERKAGRTAEMPEQAESGERDLDGLKYVVLRKGGATLAVFRVRADTGQLRRMKRWPAALNSAA